RAEQRRVEPAAMLVGSFNVKIGGEAELRVGLKHGGPARAGVEPHVEDVHLLAEQGRSVRGLPPFAMRLRRMGQPSWLRGPAGFAGSSGGQQFFDGMLVPRFRTLFMEQ